MTLPDETIDPTQWTTAQGQALAKQLFLQMDQLTAAFDIYRLIGGFPAAVRDAVTSGTLLPEVSVATLESIWALVANEIVQLRLDAIAALKLVERVGVSLGRTLPWESADAMGVSGDTAKRYVQALAESFVLLIVYYWSAGGGFEPRKQRKVYFIDPIFARLPIAGISHARAANEDGMIEDLIATALFRSASDHLTQADPSIGTIGYWRSAQGREIDFVVEYVNEVVAGEKAKQFPIEVKGDAARGIANAVASLERAFGYGVVVTRETLAWHGQVGVIPAPIFLAGLAERSERRLAIL
jgi:predicted AAA+ superfamily ATPase